MKLIDFGGRSILISRVVKRNWFFTSSKINKYPPLVNIITQLIWSTTCTYKQYTIWNI